MAQQQKVLPKPVDWDELYPGRFLKAGDFKGKQVTLTIADVNLEVLAGERGEQTKGVVAFRETEKQWALNKTNGICLKGMFGRRIPDWIGKRVTLFPATHDGDLCIRVWGSPDIERDTEVTIALPRKRPFAMTMHKVEVRSRARASKAEFEADAAPATGTATAAPPANGNIAQRLEALLRGAQSLEKLEETWASVQAIFGDGEIPIGLDAAYTEMKEALAASA